MNYTWSTTSVMGAGTRIAPLLHACRYDQRFSYYLYFPKGFHPVKQPLERLPVVVAPVAADFFTEFLKTAGNIHSDN